MLRINIMSTTALKPAYLLFWLVELTTSTWIVYPECNWCDSWSTHSSCDAKNWLPAIQLYHSLIKFCLRFYISLSLLPSWLLMHFHHLWQTPPSAKETSFSVTRQTDVHACTLNQNKMTLFRSFSWFPICRMKCIFQEDALNVRSHFAYDQLCISLNLSSAWCISHHDAKWTWCVSKAGIKLISNTNHKWSGMQNLIKKRWLWIDSGAGIKESHILEKVLRQIHWQIEQFLTEIDSLATPHYLSGSC